MKQALAWDEPQTRIESRNFAEDLALSRYEVSLMRHNSSLVTGLLSNRLRAGRMDHPVLSDCDIVTGAKASAMMDSLMLKCRACGVDPYAYLLHALTELPQHAPDADISDLLPFNFAQRQTAKPPSA